MFLSVPSFTFVSMRRDYAPAGPTRAGAEVAYFGGIVNTLTIFRNES
ncbi:hypothetical protein BKA03_002710 [Demequina lutea]|uniref:Uncharacterized protein n=1 Tax=Demequina lutea TaxID=431489 RepID=A0A7Y9ZCH2_9MICO|nr:hypothetical protein [Demequina lutea]